MVSKAFLIYGAGAMGSLFGGLLSQLHPTILIGRKPHVEGIRERGLKIDGVTEGNFSVGTATGLNGLEKELEYENFPRITHCLIFTKAYDTLGSMEDITEHRTIIGDGVVMISLQNGMDNERIISDFLPHNPIVGGYTCHGAIHDQPGHVIHTGTGATILGAYRNISKEKVEELADVLRHIGIAPTVKEEISKWIFKKVIINAPINPVTAILDIRNGELLDRRHTVELMKSVIAEGCAVGKALGIEISPSTAYEMVREVAEGTAENVSSMLQDIHKGKKTEIESINGAIVRCARERGLSAPVNETLTQLVKAKAKKK